MRTRGKAAKAAVKKHKFGKAWMHEHVSDHWVREARRQGYRSRAAYKLIELAAKDSLLRPGMTVVDLGAAPGSWSQVLRERLGPAARIVAVDRLPVEPIAGVIVVQGDVGSEATRQAVQRALGGRRADLVLCDLAPHISGIESADQAQSVALGELALAFAMEALQPGGHLVVKAFQGAGLAGLQRGFELRFDKVSVRKPKASRDRSREVFLVGRGFHPGRLAFSPGVKSPAHQKHRRGCDRARPWACAR